MSLDIWTDASKSKDTLWIGRQCQEPTYQKSSNKVPLRAREETLAPGEEKS